MTTIDGVIMTGSMGRHTKIPWNWTTGISIPNLNNLKRTGKVLLLFCDTVIVFIYQYKTNDVIIRVFDQCWVFVWDSWFIPFKLRRDLSSSSVFPLVILFPSASEFWCLYVLCILYSVFFPLCLLWEVRLASMFVYLPCLLLWLLFSSVKFLPKYPVCVYIVWVSLFFFM